jgi:putative transcription factor
MSQVNCEICGNTIRGPPKHVVIEGARLVVCLKCSVHGEDYWQPAAPSKPLERPISKPIRVQPRIRKETLPKDYVEFEIRSDYATKIRKAREKHELTQEELAKRVKERLSIIQKIEAGKMIPNIQLSRMLEHVLKMKLMIPTMEPKMPKSVVAEEAQELTIGDIIQFKKGPKPTKEDSAERKV